MGKPVDSLKNMGPVSKRQLAIIGINTAEDLINVGAKEADRRLIEAGFKPNKNRLYALIGAVEGLAWQDVVDLMRKKSS